MENMLIEWCTWIWTGARWVQTVFCIAEETCKEPSTPGTHIGEERNTMCYVPGGDG